ncbi:MAG: phosphonoacetaldehyde reductase [Bacteroidales bacterium]|nr:phosphonoacetaldehyde reductase [Bacteroidales bacterium]
MQRIEYGLGAVDEALRAAGSRRCMLVCGSSFDRLGVSGQVRAGVRFSAFTPNPRYEDVCRGVSLFNDEGCDALVAVGGGSAIDVAKCIKLFCRMDHGRNYLEQEFADSGVPLIAVPTTAGTGSESTRFAVVYLDGEKQSVSHWSIVPDVAVLEPRLLASLPPYQKKSAMLDALCQAVESWWSVNSTEESIGYSRKAVRLVAGWWREYIEEGSEASLERMMLAANLSGRAINISQTTAPHAMSYKLTSMYGVPHGHAVAMCLPLVWRYMERHAEGCVDPRGKYHLAGVLGDIGSELGGADGFESMMASLCLLPVRSSSREADLDVLARSVNPVRLKNNPVRLDEAALRGFYEAIVKE